ncbi:MAG: SRPBCC domain-containing protein [Flavobacteriales bacterium]|nr:SRPBCC domain-containing protein [Flavobacteriales bacterium]
MNGRHYQHRLTVRATPEQVYEAILRVTEWWTVNTEGNSKDVDDEFTVQFGDVHLTKQRITEAVPGKRVVWRVIESLLPWLKDREEWKGTELVFEIKATDEGTQLTFTHIGLTPQVECFAQCEKGWDYFIGESLHKLITEGAGLPDTTARTHMDTIGHVRPTNP